MRPCDCTVAGSCCWALPPPPTCPPTHLPASAAPRCSLALLRYPLAPARLSALLEHQAATAKGGRAGENIAKTFEAWALLHAGRPPAAAAVAAGAGVRSRGALALARAFAALVEQPDNRMDPEEWSRVFRACAEMGYDPLLAGPGGPRLLGVLLPKLPDLAPR